MVYDGEPIASNTTIDSSEKDDNSETSGHCPTDKSQNPFRSRAQEFPGEGAGRVISALVEQAERFDSMSVHLASSSHLARPQADMIIEWGSKLVNAINKVQREAHTAATARDERLPNSIQRHGVRANSSKRKLVGVNNLDSLRSLKTSLSLIFGLKTATAHWSRNPQKDINISAERIADIRQLCERNPDSVLTLLTEYPIKVWSQTSRGVFQGIIELVEQELEQDWPDEITDIMDELEAEKPMSAEFKYLYGMHHECFWYFADKWIVAIAQRKRRCRLRIDKSYQFGQEMPPATEEFATQCRPCQCNFAAGS